MTRKLISIITPCYNEEDNIHICWSVVKEIFDNQLSDYDYEHIFSDNDSNDNTVKILKEIAQEHKNVKVIINQTNNGPFRSLFNAQKYAQGDAIVMMLAADLQDPPELIIKFVEHWAKGHMIVRGKKISREESIIMRNIRNLYYKLVQKLSYSNIPPNTTEFQIVDKKVLKELLRYKDHYPYVRGMVASMGFPYIEIDYTWKKREHGVTKNNLYSLVDQGINGLISFSNVPMRIATISGFFIATLSILAAVSHMAANIFFRHDSILAGIPTIITGVFFFGGIQLFFIGWIGEYVSAINSQIRFGDIIHEKERINIDDSQVNKSSEVPKV